MLSVKHVLVYITCALQNQKNENVHYPFLFSFVLSLLKCGLYAGRALPPGRFLVLISVAG
jgi:hypothetical protein